MVVIAGVLLALVTLVPVRAGAQAPTAKVVRVEGATNTVQVRDWDGKLVDVVVPSQSLEDIRADGAESRGPNRATGQGKGSVMATVVSIDQQNNRMRVLTQQGQTIVIEMPTRDVQVGEKLSLVVP